MSEEQLTALLAKLKEDVGLQEKLKGAADLDAAVAIAKDAGFDVSKADWLKHQARQTLKLSDAELEGVAGGNQGNQDTENKTGQGYKCNKTVMCDCWVGVG
jgi:predicted ribosomally synthesized peptide with nif11-like leader